MRLPKVEGTTLKFRRFSARRSNRQELGRQRGVCCRGDWFVVEQRRCSDIANGYLETVKLKGYSATDSFMHIDVDPDNMKADELHVAGDVEGVTKLIVHASSNADIRGKGEILFAQSENDTTGNEGSFVVSRVYKSPYLFDVKYDQLPATATNGTLQ